MEVKKLEIQEILREREATITFIKKDGTQRIMKCTLNETKIPNDQKPKGEITRKENESVLAVFDTEKLGWRSFSLDSIISIQ